MKFMYGLLATLLLAGPLLAAEHYQMESVSIGEGRDLDPNQKMDLALADWRYVQHLVISVQAAAQPICLKISTNGNSRGVHKADAEGRIYLAVNTTLKSIEIANNCNQRVRVLKVVAHMSMKPIEVSGELSAENTFAFENDLVPDYFPEIDDLFQKNQATALAQAVLKIVKLIEPYVDLETETVPFLVPVRMAGARVLYLAQAGGVLNKEVRPAIVALVAQIVAAKPVTDSLLRRGDEPFQIAIRFLTIKERIKVLLGEN